LNGRPPRSARRRATRVVTNNRHDEVPNGSSTPPSPPAARLAASLASGLAMSPASRAGVRPASACLLLVPAKRPGGRMAPMRRPCFQFRLRTLFWFTALVAVMVYVATAMRHFEDGRAVTVVFIFMTAYVWFGRIGD
jgi:hypothetical protein